MNGAQLYIEQLAGNARAPRRRAHFVRAGMGAPRAGRYSGSGAAADGGAAVRAMFITIASSV